MTQYTAVSLCTFRRTDESAPEIGVALCTEPGVSDVVIISTGGELFTDVYAYSLRSWEGAFVIPGEPAE